MIRTSLTALTLSLMLAGAAGLAQADNSTGPTNPAPKGTNPATVGVPAGTGNGMSNGNTDGSADTASPTNSKSSAQQPASGNPEGSSMGIKKGKTGAATDSGDKDDK